VKLVYGQPEPTQALSRIIAGSANFISGVGPGLNALSPLVSGVNWEGQGSPISPSSRVIAVVGKPQDADTDELNLISRRTGVATASKPAQKGRVFLMDSMSFIFRAYHAMARQRPMSTKTGIPTAA